MYPPDREQYQSFLCVPWPDTFYLAFYQDEKLLAIAVCDRFLNATSAVYTFFDPDEHKRSLGVYAVLSQIARAQLEGLDYVYLGYWIKNCQKMSYKTQYRPIELFINEQWQQANELIT
jgi:arginine-tRNA-protein transferase